ncbi:MAG TPA: hypothetical protein PK147_07095 [Saprospiraceae bacterium]|nr:hypothetical protein [Saprospiraceae bacterium]
MKSIEVIVPRNLIKQFYLHPEPYGDGAYVVDLVNGMFTDVFYREMGDFVTITNDKEIISYLKTNYVKPKNYFLRNGVFSFRDIENGDSDLIEEWKKISPIHIQMDLPKDHKLPSEFIFCFYWIEVGKVTVESNRLTLDIHKKQFIQMIDIGVALDLLLEHLNQTDSHYGS